MGCLLGEITGCFIDNERPNTLSLSPGGEGEAFITGGDSFSNDGILLGTAT